MTKEELEKEAENWLRKYLLCCNCEKKCNCIDSNSYCEEQVLKAYVDSAEPREKRIAELEQSLLEVAEKSVERVDNLTKENTELRLKLKALDEQTPWKDIRDKSKLIERLTKATELIEDMYDAIPSSHSDYYKDVMERARQYLSEVEK